MKIINKAIDWICEFLCDEPVILPEYYSFYFSKKEMIRSQVADRYEINNLPRTWQEVNLKALCLNVLDPIREKFGAFTVSSGFRSEELNDIIQGSRNSQHIKGEAADFEIFGVDNLKVYNWIKDNLVYDQLILEYYEEGIPNSGWIHVSYSLLKNRKEAFKIGE